MRKLIALIAASAALAVLTPVMTVDMAAARSKAKSTEATPAPSKEATPSEGAASGEKGAAMPSSSGQATNQAWDQTYETDRAQEKQLKSGGK